MAQYRFLKLAAVSALATAGIAGAAQAKTTVYEAILADLSGLGGSGNARVTYNSDAKTLGVKITGTGFAPDMLHVQHIHGRVGPDGESLDSVSPSFGSNGTGGDDLDGDGVLELTEGAPKYGDILLPLLDSTMLDNGFDGFPAVTDAVGTLDFDALFDLSNNDAFNADFTVENLFPLDKREIVVHGAFLSAGIGGVGNETGDIAAGYSAFVPVAAGDLKMVSGGVSPVPLPAAAWLLMAGLGGLGAVRRFGKRTS